MSDAIFYADIGRRLGVFVDPRFIQRTLGVQPCNPGETVSYWDEAGLQRITLALILYLGETMFNMSAVNDALGIKVDSKLIEETLGIAPAEVDKRARKFSPEQMPLICMELSKHFKKRAAEKFTAPAAPAPKPAAAPAAAPANVDYDPFAEPAAPAAAGADDLFA